MSEGACCEGSCGRTVSRVETSNFDVSECEYWPGHRIPEHEHRRAAAGRSTELRFGDGRKTVYPCNVDVPRRRVAREVELDSRGVAGPVIEASSDGPCSVPGLMPRLMRVGSQKGRRRLDPHLEWQPLPGPAYDSPTMALKAPMHGHRRIRREAQRFHHCVA